MSPSVTPSPDQPFVPSLQDLGWDEFFEVPFAEHASSGFVPARIARVDRGQVTALTADGPVRATTHGGQAVCTGDWVALRPADPPEVAAILPRRTAVVRSSASRTSEGQTLAANVDTVAVVVSLSNALDPGRVERMAALAWDSGAVPVLVLTKTDSVDDRHRAEVAESAAQLAPGVEVLATSSVTGFGLDRLRDVLTGSVVLLGPSGVGKSTLGNALLGADELATGEVRAVDGKGRHTTVHRELIPLPGGGVLIDTPGLRAVGLHDSEAGLHQVFAEIEELAAQCRFTDCEHTGEPGCAVAEAIAEGVLPERRLASYRKLQRENAWAAARTDARLRAERENDRRAISRHLRATYDFRGKQ